MAKYFYKHNFVLSNFEIHDFVINNFEIHTFNKKLSQKIISRTKINLNFLMMILIKFLPKELFKRFFFLKNPFKSQKTTYENIFQKEFLNTYLRHFFIFTYVINCHSFCNTHVQ